MSRHRFLFGLFLAIAALIAGSTIGAEDDAYVPLHQFVRTQQLRDFPQHAESYLKSRFNSQEAPQALLDLLVAHGAMRQAEKAQHVRSRLILDHPASVQGGYVLGTLQNMNEFRELLKVSPAAYEAAGQLGYRYLDKLSQAILYGQSQYGDAFFNDAEFRLLAIYALSESGHGDPNGLRSSATTTKQHLRRAAEILADGTLSPADRLVKLQECRESRIVRRIQVCCLAQVQIAERGSAAIEAVLAENQLDDGELAAALPRIERLLVQRREAKFLVWRAWALCAVGRVDEAIQSLAAVEREFPADPWARPARDLHAALSTHEQNLRAHAEALDGVMIGIREGELAAIQATMYIGAKDGQRVRASLGIDVDRREAVASVWRDDQLLVSLQNNAAGSRLYYLGEEAIHEYPDLWHSLQPSFRLDRTPDGKASVNWSFGQFSPSPKSMKDQVLSSPLLRDRDGIDEFLAGFTRYGATPTKPISLNGQTVYRWLKPQATSPQLMNYEVVLDRQKRLVRLKLGSWVIEDVRFGTSREVTLVPPTWPDFPRQQHSQVGPEMFRLMAMFAELLWSDDQSVVALHPAATKR